MKSDTAVLPTSLQLIGGKSQRFRYLQIPFDPDNFIGLNT